VEQDEESQQDAGDTQHDLQDELENFHEEEPFAGAGLPR
jgi:hypothetical protein